jgi:indolepyruvate ferredoxin oxidoreductase beta subunit
VRNRLKIYLVGVGGQGTLTAAWLLGSTALSLRIEAVVSEVHGMAQRGGVVETSVLLGGFSGPIIGAGAADVILAFEPLEALRALHKASPDTWILTNTHQTEPITVALRLGEYPDIERIFAEIEGRVAHLITFEATRLAKEAGSMIATNMVMLGALAATGLLPFPLERLERAIGEFAPRFAAINLKAYRLGRKAAAEALAGAAVPSGLPDS